jgi:glutamine cyclotransferase
VAVEVLAIVGGLVVVGAEQALQHLDRGAAVGGLGRACRRRVTRCSLPGVMLQPQVSHMVGAMHPHRHRLDLEHRMLGDGAGGREGIGIREQRGFDAGERTNPQQDALHRGGLMLGRDGLHLIEQRQTDGELMHDRSPGRKPACLRGFDIVVGRRFHRHQDPVQLRRPIGDIKTRRPAYDHRRSSFCILGGDCCCNGRFSAVRRATRGCAAAMGLIAMPPRRRALVRARSCLLGIAVALLLLAGTATFGPMPSAGAPVQVVRVLERFPHDTGAFTQGLAYHQGQLYESTGNYGQSTLRRVDLDSGRIAQQRALPPHLFGEGIVVWGDRIVQLTWRAGIGLIYRRDSFEPVARFAYPGEGWGITADDRAWIISDGSHQLRFIDPEDQRELRRVEVRDGARRIRRLNELEYIDGEVWANVWHRDYIVRIDPADGRVIGYLDLTDLRPDDRTLGREAVLNGIAWDAEGRRLFVTGKYWPTLFQIEPVGPMPGRSANGEAQASGTPK